MDYFLGIIGLFIVLVGFSEILLPEKMRSIILDKCGKANWIFLGVVSLVLGIIIFISSFSGSFNIIVRVIGVLAIAKGIAAFFIKKEKKTNLLKWMSGIKTGTWRFSGVVALLVGVLLIFSRFQP